MRRSWLACTVLASTLAGASSNTFAQGTPPFDKSFSIDSFDPAPGPQTYVTMEGAGVMPNKNYSAAAYFHQSAGGLTVFTVDNNNNLKTRTEVITAESITDLTFAYAFKNKFQVGLLLPFIANIKGDGIDKMGRAPDEGVSKTTIGDTWVEFKWLAHGDGQQGLSIAVTPALTLPTSGGKDFTGEKTPTFRPRVAIEQKQGKAQFAANLGLVFRAPRTLFSSDVGQELTFALGAGYKVAKPFAVYGELTGRNGFSTKLTSSPMEIDAGGKVRIAKGISLMLGGGAGLLKGIGAPNWRAFIGVSYAPDHRDQDNDGVYDEDEGTDAMGRECLTIKEDRDGFEDSDGCPDLDNDNDGIADNVDKCPNTAEDKDGHEDADGCVDPDNDNDGVPDIKDACPNDAEDKLPPSPADGCPITKADSDGDGVADNLDKCPKEAEDKDGFEDNDGCIDPDNDNDGVPDELDECPSEAEDKDGVLDDDGCPEPDNDKDGVLDTKDKCPDKPETINGVQDNDGCPDSGGRELVALGEDGQFTLKVPLEFEKDESTLARAAGRVLDQLAQHMRGQYDVAKFRIISSPAPKKRSDDDNRALGQKRADAIAAALAARGVPAALMEAHGAAASSEQTIVVIAAKKGKKAEPPPTDGGDGSEGGGDGTGGGDPPPDNP